MCESDLMSLELLTRLENVRQRGCIGIEIGQERVLIWLIDFLSTLFTLDIYDSVKRRVTIISNMSNFGKQRTPYKF